MKPCMEHTSYQKDCMACELSNSQRRITVGDLAEGLADSIWEHIRPKLATKDPLKLFEHYLWVVYGEKPVEPMWSELKKKVREVV